MKTIAFARPPAPLPEVGGVASAPGLEETAPPVKTDFLSVMSQIYSGNAVAPPSTASQSAAPPSAMAGNETQTAFASMALTPMVSAAGGATKTTAVADSGTMPVESDASLTTARIFSSALSAPVENARQTCLPSDGIAGKEIEIPLVTESAPSTIAATAGATKPAAAAEAGTMTSQPDSSVMPSRIFSRSGAVPTPNASQPAAPLASVTGQETETAMGKVLWPALTSWLVGSDSGLKTSTPGNTWGTKPKSPTVPAKTANPADGVAAGVMMALLAQTVLPPTPEPVMVPKSVTAAKLPAGDTSVLAVPAMEARADKSPDLGSIISATSAPREPVSGEAGPAAAHPPLEQGSVPLGKVVSENAVSTKVAPPSLASPAPLAAAASGNQLVTQPAINPAEVKPEPGASFASGQGFSQAVGMSSSDGTGAALNEVRMNNTAEKNEIAGRAVKKLPRDGQVRDFWAGTGSVATAKSGSESAASNRPVAEASLAAELSAGNVSTPASPAQPAEKTVTPAVTQVEHVARLVSQEAMTIKQSGATSLAVSLNVDAHTRIFVQLNNANASGPMQATIRCERGSLEGLGNHWNDLQESLARQNIQLLPLAGGNTASNNAAKSPDFNHGSSSDSAAFQNSPGNSRGQSRQPQESVATDLLNSAPAKKTKSGASAVKGWESWA